MFWVPQSGDIGMGVSILSFGGNVQFGLVTDAAMVPDPEAIIARFNPEFEQLLYHVLMEPWGEDEGEQEAAPEIVAVKRPRRRTPADKAPIKKPGNKNTAAKQAPAAPPKQAKRPAARSDGARARKAGRLVTKI
jgi:hypothetical protein